jgi:hypothetical protein
LASTGESIKASLSPVIRISHRNLHVSILAYTHH